MEDVEAKAVVGQAPRLPVFVLAGGAPALQFVIVDLSEYNRSFPRP